MATATVASNSRASVGRLLSRAEHHHEIVSLEASPSALAAEARASVSIVFMRDRRVDSGVNWLVLC